MTKEELREIYKGKRVSMSASLKDTLNKEIITQLFTLDIWNKEYYHIFLPINKFNEINTYSITNKLFEIRKNVVASRTHFKTLSLEHYLLTKNTKIEINKWGIPEPLESTPLENLQLLDLVFVPLLIFDNKGFRVGYGKGFYDKFLAQCRPDCLKIGLSFFESINEIIDRKNTDIPLDLCVTPKKVYDFRI